MHPSLPPVPKDLALRLREEQLPQRQFRWDLDKWLPVVAGAPEAEGVLRQLPRNLGREEVRVVVQEQLALQSGIAAFVPVRIWGGPGGYGPFRARSVLTADRSRGSWQAPIDLEVEPRLLEGARVVCEEGPVEAFRLMNNSGRIKHLRGSFFTKWMAFASARVSIDSEEVAPILDERVRGWIASNTRGTTRMELSTTSTRDYALYLDLLDAWRNGEDWSRTRAQVELAIFELSRDRPAGSVTAGDS